MAALPYFNEINEDRCLWSARYAREHLDVAIEDIPEPSGADLFGAGHLDAADWDRRANLFTMQERTWFIAAVRAREAEVQKREGESGGRTAS